MLELGMHVDNWRHFDVPHEVPCQFASDHKLKYVEFGTIDGDYFIQALGYNPHIPLHSDPLKLKAYLDSLGLKTSQLDAAYPVDMAVYRAERRAVPRSLPDDPAVKTVPIFAIVGDLDGGSMIWRVAEDAWRAQGVPLKIDYVTGRRHEWLIDETRLAAVLAWLDGLPSPE